ncbi:MAG: hypothetical protein V8Q42_09845 [Anaerovoracaceae bacterium]
MDNKNVFHRSGSRYQRYRDKALFESLPSYKIAFEKKEIFYESGFAQIEEVNNEYKVSEAKQFIAFSDSRQAAAFYASDMDKTYKGILYKRFIVEVLRNGIDISGRPLSFFVDILLVSLKV